MKAIFTHPRPPRFESHKPGKSLIEMTILFGIVACTLLAYANSFAVPFLFDGIALVQDLKNLAWDDPARWITLRPRFVGYLTFDLNHTLHGDHVWGYHAVNLAIHAAAAGCVHVLTRRFMRPATAGLATAIFVLHPMQTQSVTYLYQRFEALMAMFLLAGLVCLVRSCDRPRSAAWLAGSFSCYVLSACSKEVGVVAPFLYLWFDRVFLAPSWRELWIRRGFFHLAMFGTLGIATVVVFALRDHYANGGLLCPNLVGVFDYAVTQPGVILHYLRQSVCPYDLCIDEAWPVESRPSHRVTAVVGTVFAATAVAWLMVRHPRTGFLVGSPLLILAPTSSFAPIVDLSFTHRTYAALAPLAALATLGLDRAIRPLEQPIRRRVHTGVAVATVAVLTTATAWRNTVYADAMQLWGDVVAKAPHNLRGWSNLGRAHDAAGDRSAAFACYERAAGLWFDAQQTPDAAAGRLVTQVPGRHLAVLHPMFKLGIRAMEAGEFGQAEMLFETLATLPRLPTAEHSPSKVFYNYALVLRRLGRNDEAERALRYAINSNPAYASALNELALLLAAGGRLKEAVEPLTTALAIPLPAERRARYAFNLATIYAELGDTTAAERQLLVACAAEPSRTDYARWLETLRRHKAMDAVDSNSTELPAATVETGP